MRNRLKRLFTLPAILSWIIILWKIAEWVDTMTSIFDWGRPVWGFLSSPNGTILLLVVGFGILIFLIAKPENKPSQTDPQKERELPPPVTQQQAQEQSQEYIAERLSFIQKLMATDDQLVKNIHFSTEKSVAYLFTRFCEEPDVRHITQPDIMAGLAIRLLSERFLDLTFKVLERQGRGQTLRASTISNEDIRFECEKISQAVSEYRYMVSQWMEFMEALAGKGTPKFWKRPPWSVFIHRKLADDYDELMRLVKDLRNATPRRFQSQLPTDEQITKFPRQALLG